MADETDLTGWRKKFFENRLAFESVLFERELVTPKKDNRHKSILILLALFLFHALLLSQAVLRGGGNLPREDAAAVETAYGYARAVDAGDYSTLLKPESFSVSGFKPPLYYLSFYPAFKLFSSNPSLALAAVNSFYLLVIMLAMYFAVRKGRNAPSAWLAASFAASLPFVISLGRHASPDIALMALVAATYCCYINSESFEIRKWSLLFGVCFSLGLLADTRFIVYVLPMAVFALNAFLNSRTRKNIMPCYIMVVLFPLPWYLRNYAFSFFTDLFVRNNLREAVGIGAVNAMNILHDLLLPAGAMHPVLFAVGSVSLLWFAFSIFMAYEDKELVLSWFLFPYCVFSLFSRAEGNINPALLPFAMAAGIMMPNIVRKPLLILTLQLALVYQSGVVPELTTSMGAGRIPVIGMDLVRGRDLKTEDALKSIYASSGGGKGRVQLLGEGPYFNPESLKFLARTLGYPEMTFVRYPGDYMGLADFVIYRTAGSLAPDQSGLSRKYDDEISDPGGWFSTVFRPMTSFSLADGARLSIYGKSPARPPHLTPGRYNFSKFSFGPIVVDDAIADVGPFRESDGTYDFFEIFVPHFAFQGADLYSLRFRFEGLSMVPVAKDFSGVRLTRCDTIRILSLKVQEETLGDFLKESSPYFQNLHMKFDNGLSILGTYQNLGVNLGFHVTPTGAGFKLKLIRMYLGMVGMEVPGVGGGFAEGEVTAAPDSENSMSKMQEDLAKYSKDPEVNKVLKLSGYDKLVKNASAVTKQAWVERQSVKRAGGTPSVSSGGPLSAVLARVFSMDFDFLDEDTVPFKVQVREISLKNGLLVMR